MRETKRIAVSEIDRDGEQPRKHFDEAELIALGANLKAIGQQIPILVYPAGKRFMLADGERRWRAAQLAGLAELDAVILSEKPTATQLHIAQASIDAHRSSLSPMERSDFLQRIKTENGWSVNDLAAALHMKQPLVSKYLGLQRLCLDARKMLHEGTIDIERAHVVSQQDPDKQADFLKAATSSSRDQLRRKARGVSSEPKASAARFQMPGGMVIALQGQDVTLTSAIEVLSEVVRMLKKGLTQGLDITTQQRVMRDTAKGR